jgi:hypothetical protein
MSQGKSTLRAGCGRDARKDRPEAGATHDPYCQAPVIS